MAAAPPYEGSRNVNATTKGVPRGAYRLVMRNSKLRSVVVGIVRAIDDKKAQCCSRGSQARQDGDCVGMDIRQGMSASKHGYKFILHPQVLMPECCVVYVCPLFSSFASCWKLEHPAVH